MKYLVERFDYSLVWCNTINCLAVEDAAMGGQVRMAPEALYRGRLDAHRCDDQQRHMAIIGKAWTWILSIG